MVLALSLMGGACRPAPAKAGLGDVVEADSGPDSAAMPRHDGPLRFEVHVPPSAPLGTPVPVALRLINTGGKPLDLYLQGRPVAFDIIVARPDGRIVWRRLEGQMIPAILQVRTLGPGEVLELKDEWPQRTNAGQPVGPGTYSVRGILPTDPPKQLETAAVELRVQPGR